ncbi:MAG: polysaccharide biosynthesis/export family protein [Deltaproteobacteria bacterium]|nr:polysaccharide biosynthesis/export family protein [Deltaproteobacteria bacterium]
MVTLFLAGCTPALRGGNTNPPVGGPGATTTMPVEDTTLGPGDVFDVRVFGEKELSSSYRVASDGTIDFPLIGSIVVGGLTPAETKKRIETELVAGDFLKRPQVSILVKEYTSKKVSVFGQVNKPGTFPWQEGMGVVAAISIAGGFTPMARTENTMVTRVVNGKKENYVVSVEDIGEGKTTDFSLKPGDIIFVPERVF